MENREADFSILSDFNSSKIDILVLTSYPYCLPGVNKPEDIPINYYSKMADLLPNKPVGFSEISWPSIDFFGGEQGQADFINQLPELTAELNIEFIMWPWLSDLTESDETGLINRNGTKKLGYNAWTRRLKLKNQVKKPISYQNHRRRSPKVLLLIKYQRQETYYLSQ